MDTQTAVATTIAFAPEADFGVMGSGAGQLIRRATSSLNTQKDGFASNEVLPNYQIASFRHGGQRVGGQIDGELSTESYDDWFEALLRGNWANGASVSETGHTSVAASGSVFTFGSGSLITAGFKLGDTVRFSGLSDLPPISWTRFTRSCRSASPCCRLTRRLRKEARHDRFHNPSARRPLSAGFDGAAGQA